MHYRLALPPVIAALLSMVVMASVFVYYPLTIKVEPQEPGVKFQLGSNAGKSDIGTDKIITVNLGDNNASASVTIHPTYQENYYKDVLQINNSDDNAMRIYLIFVSQVANTLPDGSVVKLFVYHGATKVNESDITNPSTGTPILIGTISAGVTWQLDFYVYIPEETDITGKYYQASVRLVYTPSAETPPKTPSSGR